MLFVLYIASIIMAVTGVPLLAVAGIVLGICYLPGLSLFTFIKKDRLMLEDLILAFPVSIGISCLLTLGFLYAGVHVKYVAFCIIGITGCGLLWSYIRKRKKPCFDVGFSIKETVFITSAFILTVLFSIPLISERVAISAHGFHHLSLVTSIFNGFFPPDNPGMGGTAIGYHWGYHTLIAAVSYPANVHPLRVFSILNIMSLFFIFCVAYRCAKSFGFSEGYRYLVPLALIGLMRSDAILYLTRNLIYGNIQTEYGVSTTPLKVLSSWVTGMSYIDTRLFFMNKFYNANNMPVGLCLIFSFFLLILLINTEKMSDRCKKTYSVALALVMIALAIGYAFYLIIPILFIPVWVVIIFVVTNGTYRDKWKENYRLILPCVVAAVVVSPYLFFITRGNSVVTAGQSADEFRFIYMNVQTIENLIVFLLPSPFIIAGLWHAYKNQSFSIKFLFLLTGSVLSVLMAVFLRFNWSNSAKFSYIIAFFFSFFFVYALGRFFTLFSNAWLKRSLVCLFVVYLLSTPLITEAAYILSPWFRDRTYSFHGRHTAFANDKSRNEAYEWLRDKTPVDTLLVLPYFETPFGITIAQPISYRPTALSERSLLVVKDVYAYLRAEYKERVFIREKLLENPGDPRVREFLTALGRPVFVIVDDSPGDYLMEGVETQPVSEHRFEEFILEFKNARQRVYRVNYL